MRPRTKLLYGKVRCHRFQHRLPPPGCGCIRGFGHSQALPHTLIARDGTGVLEWFERDYEERWVPDPKNPRREIVERRWWGGGDYRWSRTQLVPLASRRACTQLVLGLPAF